MKYTLKDNNGRDYKINDVKKFAKHIFQYHSHGSSVHEENGHYFYIDESFRKKLIKFLDV
tara:strand:+ start:75 stop:254 length:180 start_codon:yes stop_codon:yes gene_type:complete